MSHFIIYRSSLITTKIDYYTAVFKQQQQKKTRAVGLLLSEEETPCLTHAEGRTHPRAANKMSTTGMSQLFPSTS